MVRPQVKNKKINTRTYWIDTARGIAIMTIITAHVWIVPFSQIGRAFQLPLFAMLTGILCQTPRFDWEFFRKKAQKFFIPYALAALGSLIFWILVQDNNTVFSAYPLDAASLLRPVLLGLNPFYDASLWFLPSFFIAVIIWNFVTTIPKRLTTSLKLFWTGFFFLTGFTLLSIFDYSTQVPFSVDLSFLFAGFIGIGSLTSRSFHAQRKPLIPFLFWTAVFAIGYWGNGPVTFFARHHNNSLLFLLNTISGSFASIFCAQWLEQQTNIFLGIAEVLRILGKKSIVLLVYHWPVLIMLNWLLGSTPLFSRLGAQQNLINITLQWDQSLHHSLIAIMLFVFYSAWTVVMSLSFHKIISSFVRTIRRNVTIRVIAAT